MRRLHYQTLKRWRPCAIVVNLILGAFLTTPEVLTQVVMALVLQTFYEAAVWNAWYSERKEKKAEKG
jgi:sec-independent protein translocase protein TatC